MIKRIFLGLLIPLLIGLCVMAFCLLTFELVIGEEVSSPPPLSYDLPPVEALEWRGLELEARTIRAEAQLAIRRIMDRQEVIKDMWQDRYKIDLKTWNINTQEKKIYRIGD